MGSVCSRGTEVLVIPLKSPQGSVKDKSTISSDSGQKAGEDVPQDGSITTTQEPTTTSVTAVSARPSSSRPPLQWVRGQLIGSGAFGKVYLGLNQNTGELLAIKHVKISGDPELLAKEVASLKHEIGLLRDLSHPNIVRYLHTEVCEDKTAVDILLEYVPGGSIRSILDRFGRLDEKVVRLYTKQILAGLVYLHDHGIIHRDIKSANILVDHDGTVKVSDFGASKRLFSGIQDTQDPIDEESRSLKGSPFWMAPEVVRRTGHGRPADIWSVACTVIEMVTGRPPWSDICQSNKEVLLKIASCESSPPLPDNLSADGMDFLYQCFQQKPELRPLAVTLLSHPFVATEYKGPPTKPPTTSPSLSTNQNFSFNQIPLPNTLEMFGETVAAHDRQQLENGFANGYANNYSNEYSNGLGTAIPSLQKIQMELHSIPDTSSFLQEQAHLLLINNTQSSDPLIAELYPTPQHIPIISFPSSQHEVGDESTQNITNRVSSRHSSVDERPIKPLFPESRGMASPHRPSNPDDRPVVSVFGRQELEKETRREQEQRAKAESKRQQWERELEAEKARRRIEDNR
eukprot:GILJ01006206.1.p1 GENE.GILJ01006206.1~~GILJ01006206.1.p1  ORF type:complete len:573 (+),score=81.34 GILJ01006206.1:77-1795(+)